MYCLGEFMRSQSLIVLKHFTGAWLILLYSIFSFASDQKSSNQFVNNFVNQTFWSKVKGGLTYYRYNGEYSYLPETKSVYINSNIKFDLGYAYSDQFKFNFSTAYKEKVQSNYQIQNNENRSSENHEYGILDPAFGVIYSFKLKNAVSNKLKLSLVISPSLGSKKEYKVSDTKVKSESRLGYSYYDTKIAFSDTVERTSFGASITYRSTSRGQKDENGSKVEFDPEKWVTTNLTLSYRLDQKLSMGPSLTLYRPALLNGRDYQNRMIGMFIQELALNYKFNDLYTFTGSYAQSSEKYLYNNGSSQYNYSDNILSMGLHINFSL